MLISSVNSEDISWRERLKRLMVEEGVSQAELAPIFGVSRAAVSHYMTGRTEPTVRQLSAVAKHIGVSLDYLVGGESIPNGVPLLSWSEIDMFLTDWHVFDFEPGFYISCPMSSVSRRAFAVKVQGDSMEATDGYRHGDLIFVDPEKAASHGSDIIAGLPKRPPLLRRLSIHEDCKRYLRALNQDLAQEPIELPLDAQIYGVVIFSGRPRGAGSIDSVSSMNIKQRGSV